MENKTQWEEEAVSESEVTPVEEMRLDDVKGFLVEQSDNARLKILFYSNRIPEIPDDDEDLVYRGIIWTRKMGEIILENFRKYHPHLISRIQKGLEENLFFLAGTRHRCPPGELFYAGIGGHREERRGLADVRTS